MLIVLLHHVVMEICIIIIIIMITFILCNQCINRCYMCVCQCTHTSPYISGQQAMGIHYLPLSQIVSLLSHGGPPSFLCFPVGEDSVSGVVVVLERLSVWCLLVVGVVYGEIGW